MLKAYSAFTDKIVLVSSGEIGKGFSGHRFKELMIPNVFRAAEHTERDVIGVEKGQVHVRSKPTEPICPDFERQVCFIRICKCSVCIANSLLEILYSEILPICARADR